MLLDDKFPDMLCQASWRQPPNEYETIIFTIVPRIVLWIGWLFLFHGSANQ